jgi:Holliday junction resolvase RusA-like endonuclease
MILAEKLKNGWELNEKGYDLTINFFCYRPPSMRNLSEEELKNTRHVQKPDLDNMIKYILDCGNKILWHDDAEIYNITATKFWSKTPRTEIKINGR